MPIYALFWHNHFPVNDINDPKLLYDYVTKLRQHGTGNFRTLVKEITLDPAMLRYAMSIEAIVVGIVALTLVAVGRRHYRAAARELESMIDEPGTP